jgi:carbamoyl-phosphate synthase small subunit
MLREKGAQAGCIMAVEIDEQRALAEARAFPGLAGMDLARVVSVAASYEWTAANGAWAATGLRRRRICMSSPTISASSTTFCACSPRAAAG